MTTYTIPNSQTMDRQTVECAWSGHGLVVHSSPCLCDDGRMKRWRISHQRSGQLILKELDRKTAVAIAERMVELEDWNLPASAFQARNRKRTGTLRHMRIAQLARANPREFAKNGGGMEKK